MRSEKGTGRSASNHYDTMTLGDIGALPVRQAVDVDCWLFLWATSAMLPEAMWVMGEWGFRYSGTAFVWAKLNKTGSGYFTGMGFTTRKNAEFCLLGRCGEPSRLRRDVRELIVSPRREHSRKPDEARERIEQFCAGPRLELFGRARAPGWRVVGNEVNKF